MCVCGVRSLLWFSSSPCFLLSGVCRRGRGENHLSRHAGTSWILDYFFIISMKRAGIRSRTPAHRDVARVTVDDSQFRNVVTHGPSFTGRAMTQAKFYSAIGKVIRVVHLPPDQGPAASVSCARTRGRASPPSPKFTPLASGARSHSATTTPEIYVVAFIIRTYL